MMKNQYVFRLFFSCIFLLVGYTLSSYAADMVEKPVYIQFHEFEYSSECSDEGSAKTQYYSVIQDYILSDEIVKTEKNKLVATLLHDGLRLQTFNCCYSMIFDDEDFIKTAEISYADKTIKIDSSNKTASFDLINGNMSVSFNDKRQGTISIFLSEQAYLEALDRSKSYHCFNENTCTQLWKK